MTTASLENPCIGANIDVVFLLDGSGSMSEVGFRMTKEFLAAMAESLSIGTNMTQVGVVQFSDRFSLDIRLNTFTQSSTNLANAIRAIPYHSAGTQIGEAIDFALNTAFTPLTGDRVCSPDVIVVITDGLDRGEMGIVAPVRMAGCRHIMTIGVGVGGSVSEEQLLQIADGDPTRRFQVSSVADLDSIHRKLCSVIKGKPANPCTSSPCSRGATCIPRDDFQDFTCLCPSGYTGKLCEIELDECESSPCVHGECFDRIDRYNCVCDDDYQGINCQFGTIREALGRYEADPLWFSQGTLSDLEASFLICPDLPEYKLLHDVSADSARHIASKVPCGRLCRLFDALVYVVELSKATETDLGMDNERVGGWDWLGHRVQGRGGRDSKIVERLTIIKPSVSNKRIQTLEVIAAPIVEVNPYMLPQVDMLFLVDNSGSVGLSNFSLVRTFLHRLLDHVILPSNKENTQISDCSQIGIILFNREPKIMLQMISETSKVLGQKIDQLPYEGHNTRMGAALMKAYEMLKPEAVARFSVPKVCIVVSDGFSEDDITKGAASLHTLGVTTIAIGIRKTNNETFLRLTRRKELIFHVNSFDDLKLWLRRRIVEELKEALPKRVKERAQERRPRKNRSLSVSVLGLPEAEDEVLPPIAIESPVSAQTDHSQSVRLSLTV